MHSRRVRPPYLTSYLSAVVNASTGLIVIGIIVAEGNVIHRVTRAVIFTTARCSDHGGANVGHLEPGRESWDRALIDGYCVGDSSGRDSRGVLEIAGMCVDELRVACDFVNALTQLLVSPYPGRATPGYAGFRGFVSRFV